MPGGTSETLIGLTQNDPEGQVSFNLHLFLKKCLALRTVKRFYRKNIVFGDFQSKSKSIPECVVVFLFTSYSYVA
jgi:hypothetical protein